MIKEVSYKEGLWRKKFYPVPDLDYRRLRMSDVGLYSICKPVFIDLIRDIIRKRFRGRSPVITDGTAGMGMISIILAKDYRVTAVEKETLHAEMIRNNARVYGVSLDVITDDYTKVFMRLRQDVVVLDPPWKVLDGKYYKEKDLVDLMLSGINVVDIINMLDAKLIILFAPYNFNIAYLIQNVKRQRVSVHRVLTEKHYVVCIR